MWQFKMTVEAEIDFARLDRAVQIRIAERLRWFQTNFERIIPLPLGGKWLGFFKLRAGDWRVIYDTNDAENLIMVHLIDHRRKIYKRRPPA